MFYCFFKLSIVVDRAAHCIVTDNQRLPVNTLRIFVGATEKYGYGEEYQVATYNYHSGYSSKTNQNDIAVIMVIIFDQFTSN